MNHVNEIDESSDEIIDIAEGDAESFDLELDENHDYVYLLHPAPFADNEIPIYKIGRTYRSESRFVSYPKNSIIYHIQRVQNCRYTEKQMIKTFHKYFEHNEKCGDEYFSGKMSRMIKCIKYVVSELGQEKESDKEYEQNLIDRYKSHLRFRTNEINDITGGIIPNNAREILNSGYQREIKKKSVTRAKELTYEKCLVDYTCSKCSKQFIRKHNYDNHVKNEICSRNIYRCRYCDDVFTTATSMYRHVRKYCEIKKLIDHESQEMKSKNKENKRLKNENQKLRAKINKMEKTIKADKVTNNYTVNIDNSTQIVIQDIDSDNLCSINDIDNDSTINIDRPNKVSNKSTYKKIAPRNGKKRKAVARRARR